jgi:hypothetical protein
MDPYPELLHVVSRLVAELRPHLGVLKKRPLR